VEQSITALDQQRLAALNRMAATAGPAAAVDVARGRAMGRRLIGVFAGLIERHASSGVRARLDGNAMRVNAAD
jgi:hypothetical protein